MSELLLTTARALRYVVVFTEYGNSQECSLALIRPPTEAGAAAAEGYSVGESVWAMWDEDHKWYLAQVSEKMAGGKYRVTFTEYGNEQVCSADMMRAGVDKASATAAKTNTGESYRRLHVFGLLTGRARAAAVESGVKVVARFGAAAADGARRKHRIEIPQASMPGDIANYKMPNYAKQQ